MVLRLLPLVLVFAILLASPAAGQNRPPAQNAGASQSALLKQGISHFEKAFYELTPKNRRAEADAEFDQAVAALEAELGVNPASADAHRYLARIDAVRKDFPKAAAHYDRVSELEPFNVDACVLAALAYLDAKNPTEARLRLVAAKDRSLDAAVLARLDEYIAKVDALKR